MTCTICSCSMMQVTWLISYSAACICIFTFEHLFSQPSFTVLLWFRSKYHFPVLSSFEIPAHVLRHAPLTDNLVYKHVCGVDPELLLSTAREATYSEYCSASKLGDQQSWWQRLYIRRR